MSGKMTTLLVVQVGCADGRFASTTKLDRRPLPSIIHIASAKEEIVAGEALSPPNRLLGVTERISISSARRYAVTRHQLPPQYPGGSTERRVCLEGTRKDSTASGARPWTAAAHAAGTHRTRTTTELRPNDSTYTYSACDLAGLSHIFCHPMQQLQW
jgi:hypothetical protein